MRTIKNTVRSREPDTREERTTCGGHGSHPIYHHHHHHHLEHSRSSLTIHSFIPSFLHSLRILRIVSKTVCAAQVLLEMIMDRWSNNISLAPPSALLLQLASLSFILCGIHNDLLVIRFYVSLSYGLLIVNALLSAHQLSGTLSLDNLLWSLLGLYMNGTALVALIRDERPVRLKDDDHDALWRLLYRSGGLSKRLFASNIAPHLHIKELPAGQVIPTNDQFYLVYTGHVRLQVLQDDDDDNINEKQKGNNHDNNNVIFERLVQSGQMFDLRFLELFGEYNADRNFFQKGRIVCETVTACKLFCFTRHDIRQIAHHPLAKGVWQSLLINDMAIRSTDNNNNNNNSFSSSTTPSTPLHDYDYYSCDNIFDPLHDWEKPKSTMPGSGVALQQPVKHFVTSVWRSLLLPWPMGVHPQGIRQTLMPTPSFTSPPSTSSQSSSKSQSRRRQSSQLGRVRQDAASKHNMFQSSWKMHWFFPRWKSTKLSNTPGDASRQAGQATLDIVPVGAETDAAYSSRDDFIEI